MAARAINRTERSTLGVEVEFLKGEIHGVREQVNSLSSKVDTSINALGGEMRTSLAGLAVQLNERAKTPWAVIWPGLAVLVAMIGFIAHQTIDPIQQAIIHMGGEIVPRAEHVVRAEYVDARLEQLEARQKIEDDRRYIERMERIKELEIENRALRHLSP